MSHKGWNALSRAASNVCKGRRRQKIWQCEIAIQSIGVQEVIDQLCDACIICYPIVGCPCIRQLVPAALWCRSGVCMIQVERLLIKLRPLRAGILLPALALQSFMSSCTGTLSNRHWLETARVELLLQERWKNTGWTAKGGQGIICFCLCSVENQSCSIVSTSSILSGLEGTQPYSCFWDRMTDFRDPRSPVPLSNATEPLRFRHAGLDMDTTVLHELTRC